MNVSFSHLMVLRVFAATVMEYYIVTLEQVYFGMLDALLASEQLPEEYRGREQDILCNDCELKGRAPFHWLYHKCRSCGSYNTRAI
ncbi:hypothetical protein L7F22_018107 [Adiantum nelumboides]|nr:hypothetical protein [Adiantum nelumboides]